MILVPNKASLDQARHPIPIMELDQCPLSVFPLTTLVIHSVTVVRFVRGTLGHLVVRHHRLEGRHEGVRHRVDRLEVVKLGPTVQVQVAALLNPRVPAHATPNHSSLVDLPWILVVPTHLLPSVSLLFCSQLAPRADLFL